MDFKKIELSDREWMEKRFAESDFRTCDHSFRNLYIWRHSSNISVADKENMLLIKSSGWDNKQTLYTYPAGNGNLLLAIDTMIKDAKANRDEFVLRGIPAQEVEKIEKLMPGRFEFEEKRDDFEYIYSVEKMANLAGKKYHGKRNHIARFMDNDGWHYENMSMENIDKCREMNRRWCELNSSGDNNTASLEQMAVQEAFDNFEKLGFKGGVLYIQDEVVAFTIGAPINSDTFGVHIEKADYRIQGAYPMINREFVRANMSDFTYINREEDLGEEGLRKAKLSYYPEMFVEKWTAVLKRK